MFWIHGSGFGEGSSSVSIYDGAALAKKGVVLVTVNYRLGALGFLVHPDLAKESEHHSSGNYGLLDQIAALQWVHKNIAAFGGDPERVTIFGQSAGAIAAQMLMKSPLAQGLFARAIAESGPGLGFALAPGPTMADRESAGVKYAEYHGARSLPDLRAIPAENFATDTPGSPSVEGVVVDGWVVPSAPPASQVPLIVGFVADDILLGDRGSPPPSTLSAYRAGAQKYREHADAFLRLYPTTSDADVAAMQKLSARDRTRLSVDLWAANQLKLSKKVYTYYFDRAIPWPEHPEFGAFHTSEVPYVFGNIRVLDRPWQPVDEKVSDELSSYWVNFAATGDPNGMGLPKWPAYSDGSHVTMELGARTGAMPVAEPARLEFFKADMQRPKGNQP